MSSEQKQPTEETLALRHHLDSLYLEHQEAYAEVDRIEAEIGLVRRKLHELGDQDA